MNRPLRILFFTPSGGRTGSEMALWNLLHRFDRSRFQAAVHCERPGELLRELPPDVRGFTSPFQGTSRQRLWAKLRNGMGTPVYDNYLEGLNRSFRPDCWYLNTINMAHLSHVAQKLGVPVVGHVHEISHLLYQDVTARDLESLIQNARFLIGDAKVVCDELRIMGGERVHLLYESVDFSALQPDPARARQLRRDLGIADSNFVWLMSGSPIYRKGVDLVPAIARQLPERTHLIWTGGVATPNASFFLVKKQLEHDGRRNVHFVGAQAADYAHYLAAADGFVLTSREEAFGMVNLEAAYLGKPIVAFDAGGIREILTKEMGVLVPNGDVPALVEAMKTVMEGRHPVDPAVAKTQALAFGSDRLVEEWHRIMATF